MSYADTEAQNGAELAKQSQRRRTNGADALFAVAVMQCVLRTCCAAMLCFSKIIEI